MAGIDSIVTVAITKTSVNASRTSFGIGAILAYTTWLGGERVRTYTKLSGVLADFPAVSTVNHPVYDAASKFFGQDPRPKKFKVLRRANVFTETYSLKVLAAGAVEGYVHNLTLQGTAITYTVLAAATPTTVATALELLIEAVTGITSSSSTDTITITNDVPGNVTRWGAGIDHDALEIKNTTPDPGIVADLTACLAADPDIHDIGFDSKSQLQLVAAAAYTASMDRELWYSTIDTLCTTSSSADVGSALKASAYVNVTGFFDRKSTRNYREFGAMGVACVRDPGSYTLMFKTLIADEGEDTLSDTVEGYVLGKNLNTYQDLGAGPMVNGGKVASGEYEDVTRFLHWQKQEIKVAYLRALAGPPKQPFTNGGIDAVGTAVRGAIAGGVAAGGVAPEPPFTVTVPDVLDVPEADRDARNLPGVEFSFRLAGAIHKGDVEGTVSA